MAPIAKEDLAELRRYLMRFALLHLRDRNRAEDAVQETLTAALEREGGFTGGSAVRT